MHVQTHILSGWCLGNLLPLSGRERLFCMLAAALPDLDGLSRAFGEEAYWDYHHVVGHNLAFGLVLSAALTAFSTHRTLAFAAYVALFHLHLVMDYYGSGPGWGIAYLWPFSQREARNPHAWPFYSWQNLSTAGVFVAWTFVLIPLKGRTPLERVMPSLDRQLVDRIRRRPGRGARPSDSAHEAAAAAALATAPAPPARPPPASSH